MPLFKPNNNPLAIPNHVPLLMLELLETLN
jgi:hypothetical protein